MLIGKEKDLKDAEKYLENEYPIIKEIKVPLIQIFNFLEKKLDLSIEGNERNAFLEGCRLVLNSVVTNYEKYFKFLLLNQLSPNPLIIKDLILSLENFCNWLTQQQAEAGFSQALTLVRLCHY